MTGPTPLANHRDDRHGARSAPSVTSMHAIQLRASLLPPSVIAALGVGIVVFVVIMGMPAATIRLVLAGAAGAVAVTLVAGVYAASAATRQVDRQIRIVRSLTLRGQNELQQQVRRILVGEQPVPRIAAPGSVTGDDPIRLLAHDLEQSQYVAEQAVLRIAAQVPAGTADQRVEIFVNLARRMQSLVHREIELLDDLEAKVEDPDLLKGLFTVDHLATRMRRQSESLAVLGGTTSRRQWSRQVTMHEVLRAAVAEVEHYSRVKVVPPVEGVLAGSAVSDVIHLIAELVENATKFSPPRTNVLLRAQLVTAGVALEVEDRGLGMLAADRERMNALLADPSRVNVGELLRDGRIGLFVVSTLSRRHGIKVQLQNNIYGGIQAVAVLPNALIDGGEGARQFHRPELLEGKEPDAAGAVAASVPAASPAVLPSPPLSSPPPSSPPPLPVRHVTRPAEADDGQASVAATAATAPAAEFPELHGAAADERPPLPKRKVQTHLAPELRDSPETKHDEQPAEQMTGLMADFRRGVSLSDEEDSAARD